MKWNNTLADFYEKSGVYKIINTIDRRVYIGSAINLRKRKNMHKHDLINNCHRNFNLQLFVNKYGIDKLLFEVIEIVDTKTQLIEREQFYLDTILFADKNDHIFSRLGFNILRSSHGWDGHTHSLESKNKISKSKTGKKTNRVYDENFRKKMSEVHKGKILTKETISKRNLKICKPVIQFDLKGVIIKEWESATIAAQSLGLKSKGNIGRCCKGFVKKIANSTWKYKSDYYKKSLL